MSTTYARRRVATRLTRSTSSKSSNAQQSSSSNRSKSPAKSASPPGKEDIRVPSNSTQPLLEQQQASIGHDSSLDIVDASLSQQDITLGASHAFPLQSSNELPDPMSPCNPSFASIYTPSRSSTFSASVSSKRKASNSSETDPNLRRSVRQRAEASPFRLDSTEAQRDSTLFISQPQTPSKLKESPTNRKDSLFMSLPASFADASKDAQYAPIFDLSLLSANSNISCFLPIDPASYPSTTPAQGPPLSGISSLSPAFDFLQYSDFIAPFPPTPQPAFLNFPPTPTRFSGSFAIAPNATTQTPVTAGFAVPMQFGNERIEKAGNACEKQGLELPKTPLDGIRPLPRRARRSSACSSSAGSIIIKDVDEEEEESEDEEEGDETALPDSVNAAEQTNEEDDERFALFASQVRRKAEALNLRSSQGTTSAFSPAQSFSFSTDNVPNNGIDISSPSWNAHALHNNIVASLHDAAGQQQGQAGVLSTANHEGIKVGIQNIQEKEGAGASHSRFAKQNQIDILNLPPMPTPLPPLPTQYTSEKENNLNEGYEMGVSPNKPEKPKRGHHNKDRGGKPPRPPNCFILYRSDKVEEIRSQQTAKDKMQKDISKVVAELWKQEPQSVKDEYQRRADVAREEHLLKYPGYVYQPTRKDKPTDEDFSPLKRSGSMRPQTNLSRSAPASRVQHSRSNTLEDDTSDIDESAQSPTPSKASRSRTPLKQSRIPVPMSLNKGATYRPSQRQPVQSQGAQSGISGFVRKPVQANRPGASIVKNAADFANQRGLLDPSFFNGNGAPVSTPMSKSRSAPSHAASSVAQTPSAPRYAKPTAASMSKSLSQPVAPVTQTAPRTASVHPQHQYAAYSHLQQPMPQNSNQMVASRAGLFEQMLSTTPTDHQRLVFPDVTPPEGQHSKRCPDQRLATGSEQQPSAGRPNHQRAHTTQPASGCQATATPSRAPSMRRKKTSPPQGTPGSPAIPDGFVIGGKLYPYENVEEAMKAFQSAAPTPQKSTNRILSNHSNASNGPVQEIAMPMPSAFEQQDQQPQFYAPPVQNYVIGIAPDGQQIPLLLSQPQSVTTFAPWQSVPAFTPSSTLATPSTGFAYDFGQSQDSLQTFDYNSVFTPNTANSNVSNMPLSGTTWFPQQSLGNVDMATSNFLVTNDPTLGGISPTFYLNDANGQQQAYTLAGPPVSVDIGEVTDFTQSQDNVQQWAIA